MFLRPLDLAYPEDLKGITAMGKQVGDCPPRAEYPPYRRLPRYVIKKAAAPPENSSPGLVSHRSTEMSFHRTHEVPCT